MVNENHMKGDLGEIDQFLTRMTNLNLRFDYQGCTNLGRQDAYEMFMKEKQELNESSELKVERTMKTRQTLLTDVSIFLTFQN